MRRSSGAAVAAVLLLTGCGISEGTDIAEVLADEEFIGGGVNCGNASVEVTTAFTCFIDDLAVGETGASPALEVAYLSDDEILVEGV
ncbi:hypothetical protein [Nesterenkonia suensis]